MIVAGAYLVSALYVTYRALDAANAMTWRTRHSIRCAFYLLGAAAFSEAASVLPFLLYKDAGSSVSLGDVAFMTGVALFFAFDKRRWYRMRALPSRVQGA